MKFIFSSRRAKLIICGCRKQNACNISGLNPVVVKLKA